MITPGYVFGLGALLAGVLLIWKGSNPVAGILLILMGLGVM